METMLGIVFIAIVTSAADVVVRIIGWTFVSEQRCAGIVIAVVSTMASLTITLIAAKLAWRLIGSPFYIPMLGLFGSVIFYFLWNEGMGELEA